jgi:L-lactate utilization protein LutC
MDYAAAAPPQILEKAARALGSRGIVVERAESKEAALARLVQLIPDGVPLMTAASLTLQQIGFEELLASGRHSWRSLRAEVRAENDPAKRSALRRQSAAAEYCAGSVQAVAATGEIVIVSQTGSQLAPYLAAGNVLWVVGTQKFVPTLEEAIHRAREYCAAKVEELGRSQGRPGLGTIGKMLVFEREVGLLNRAVRMIIVNGVLGI